MRFDRRAPALPVFLGVLVLGLTVHAGVSGAEDPLRLEAAGYLQFRWTALEQVENGLRQPITGDEAADVASGFSLRRARAWVDYEAGRFHGRVGLRLEGSPVGLLDAYVVFPLAGRGWGLWLGQMKVPSAYEVGILPSRLDFATRSRFADRVADLSLSRSPALSSPRLNGVRTYDRDLGIALKGETRRLQVFCMVGNGLGANRFVGGGEHKEEVYANRLGAHLYALRLSFAPLPGTPRPPVRCGGHVSWNHHPELVFDDERTVMDLERRSWSLDAAVRARDRVTFTALLGGGQVDDDFDADGRTDYRYRGGEVKIVADLRGESLRAAFRYDGFTEERYENAAENRHQSWTAGLTLRPSSPIRLRLDYRHHRLESDVEPDLDDDSLLFEAQVEI